MSSSNMIGIGRSRVLAAETHWFHMFVAMIRGGDLSKIGPYATSVYLVIKAYTNFSTGEAFPALELISEKSGISLAQVKRELKRLESHGYIVREKRGRSNIYRLREKVEISDGEGRTAAVATWDYLPSGVRQAVADLKNVLVSGHFSGAQVIQIECLQVNINHLHENARTINVQNYHSAWSGMPESIRERKAKAGR